jgi:RNA polymerase-binding transcription factor DksA
MMSGLNDKTLEMAERLVAAQVDVQVARARTKQSDLAQFAGWDGETCFDCGDAYPAERIAMGRVRCVHCQEVAEKKGKG